MGTAQTTTKEERLSTLFPAMNTSTIQNTLNEANGDTAKAIVLLLQTPSNSVSIASTNSHKHNSEFFKNSKNKRTFMKQQFKQSPCNSCTYIASILFWICIALILIVTIILTSADLLVDKSFSFTLCFCSIIELIFTLLILYGVLSYQTWSIWVTLLWSILHGITFIYSLIKWHNNSQFILYYIGIVVVYWLFVMSFNIAYFINLNRIESRFNYLIAETNNAVNKQPNATEPQKIIKDTLTPNTIASEIVYDNTTLKTNKNEKHEHGIENNDNEHQKQDTADIGVDELINLALDAFDDMNSDKESNNDQSNDESVIIKLDAE